MPQCAPRPKRLAALRLGAVTLAVTLGCETTATIRRPDGTAYEAEIYTSTPSSLVLRDADGSSISLGQREVSEVDHPGNVAAGIAAGVAVISARSLLASTDGESCSGRSCPLRSGGFVLGISGLILGALVLGANLAISSRSKSRAQAFERARPPAAPPSGGRGE